MSKFLPIAVLQLLVLLPLFLTAQQHERSEDGMDPRNPLEAFYHADMGLPMNYNYGFKEVDSTFDASGNLVKRTYTVGTRAFTETWAYHENGKLSEYISHGHDTIQRHETFDVNGNITEYYAMHDGFPEHWTYTYSTFKLNGKKILRKVIYNTSNQVQAALEFELTDNKEILYRSFQFSYNSLGHISTERVRYADGLVEIWHYNYEGKKHYKSLRDANGEEVEKVWLD
jgi:hypothetical protein